MDRALAFYAGGRPDIRDLKVEVLLCDHDGIPRKIAGTWMEFPYDRRLAKPV
jgi:hypothetical protein